LQEGEKIILSETNEFCRVIQPKTRPQPTKQTPTPVPTFTQGTTSSRREAPTPKSEDAMKDDEPLNRGAEHSDGEINDEEESTEPVVATEALGPEPLVGVSNCLIFFNFSLL
jgi:hypothetical protein